MNHTAACREQNCDAAREPFELYVSVSICFTQMKPVKFRDDVSPCSHAHGGSSFTPRFHPHSYLHFSFSWFSFFVHFPSMSSSQTPSAETA